MTCRTLMAYTVDNVNSIEMPRESEKASLEKLKIILQQEECADWITYVIMLGDHSKSLLEMAHDELPDYRTKRGTFIIRGPAAGDKAMLQLGKYCRNIEAFVILRCNNFTNGRIRYLARKCTSINTFCINSGQFDDSGLKALGEFLQQLTFLNIKNCEKLTSEGFIEFAKYQRSIKHLNMENCNSVKDDGMIALVQNCRTIERLSIASCWELTDESVFYITACLQGLTFFNISRINTTDTALHHIAQFCTQLDTLIITQLSDRTTTEGICKVIRESPHLKNLNLMYDDTQVTDNVVQLLAGNCTSIENLNVGHCTQLTDQSLISLGASGTLRMLNVFACFRFTLDCIMNLKQALPSLQVIGEDSI